MRILRTIETFLPNITGPSNQAYEISKHLELRGISSPVVTTYLDVDKSLPKKEMIGPVSIKRVPIQFRIMRYAISLSMFFQLRRYEIMHCHNYRNFQTDYAFFLPI